MHLLNALGELNNSISEAKKEMSGPTLTSRCMNECAVQYRLFMANIATNRRKARKVSEHPILKLIERWFDAQVAPLLNGKDDLTHWNQSHKALDWIRVNAAATSEFLTVWGDVSEAEDDATPVYCLRHPEPDDAPDAGGGRLRTLWNETARSFQARKSPIAMPLWSDADHRRLFLLKSGRPSRRAQIVHDVDGRMHGFFVHDMKGADLNIEVVGFVSGIEKIQKEALGMAYAALWEANKPEEHSVPLHINLRMPRPTAPVRAIPQGVLF